MLPPDTQPMFGNNVKSHPGFKIKSQVLLRSLLYAPWPSSCWSFRSAPLPAENVKNVPPLLLPGVKCHPFFSNSTVIQALLRCQFSKDEKWSKVVLLVISALFTVLSKSAVYAGLCLFTRGLPWVLTTFMRFAYCRNGNHGVIPAQTCPETLLLAP